MRKLNNVLRLSLILSLIGIMMISLSTCSAFANVRTQRQKKKVVEQYLETVHNSKYIMHAFGGVDGIYSYTNSIDALEQAYAEGYRLFEADVSFTSDGRLVMAHGKKDVWTQADWEERLGQPYNPDKPSATYDEFMNFQIQGRFKATSFAEVVDFMEQHNDMFLLADVGSRDAEETKRIYQAMVDVVGTKREAILWHLITGGHSTDATDAAQEVYPFPIQNLYFAHDKVREKSIYEPKDFLKYCKEHGILSFSVAEGNYTTALNDPDIISYVFTVDDSETADGLFKAGVNVVGTNFLRE